MNWKDGCKCKMSKEDTAKYNTLTDQLSVLNDAIYKILVGGKSYKIGTRSVTRADLKTLIEERDRIESQLCGDGTSLIDGAYAADFGPDNRR